MTDAHGGGGPTYGPLTFEELQLAGRNRGMPLEAMRYDLTPTGLHYLLIHFDIPVIEAREWRLQVGGEVSNDLELTLDDVQALPKRTIPVTLECAGNGRARLSPRPLSQPWLVEAIGTAEWTGASLADVLDAAGPLSTAIEAVFNGADSGIQGDVPQNYARSLLLEAAMNPDILLAYEMNGEPLQPQHGHPLRLVVPGWYGMASVKWLTSIDVVSEPFAGYQQQVAYRYQSDPDDPGELVSRIRVRSLLIPPGVPEFFSRRRFVDAGQVPLSGRAWSGQGGIERVEVGVDGRWSNAKLGPSGGEYAWREWTFDWTAEPGEHELASRATDSAGNTQPLEQPWNYQGMGNNLVHRMAVTVT